MHLHTAQCTQQAAQGTMHTAQGRLLFIPLYESGVKKESLLFIFSPYKRRKVSESEKRPISFFPAGRD